MKVRRAFGGKRAEAVDSDLDRDSALGRRASTVSLGAHVKPPLVVTTHAEILTNDLTPRVLLPLALSATVDTLVFAIRT